MPHFNVLKSFNVLKLIAFREHPPLPMGALRMLTRVPSIAFEVTSVFLGSCLGRERSARSVTPARPTVEDPRVAIGIPAPAFVPTRLGKRVFDIVVVVGNG